MGHGRLPDVGAVGVVAAVEPLRCLVRVKVRVRVRVRVRARVRVRVRVRVEFRVRVRVGVRGLGLEPLRHHVAGGAQP